MSLPSEYGERHIPDASSVKTTFEKGGLSLLDSGASYNLVIKLKLFLNANIHHKYLHV